MSVRDFIKKSILESDVFTLNYSAIVVSMVVALVIGLLICYIYTKFFRGVVYSRTFATTLVGMTVMTCMVTLAISTNIVISLGMVGALSIVRYRTAIKEPLDLLYLFWAITSGIAVGAQMYALCAIAAVILIIVLLIMTRRGAGGKVYITILHYEGDLVGDAVEKAMGNAKYRIKSKTLAGEQTEMAMEVYCKGNNMAFLEKLRATPGVQDVTLIQYDGEYHG